VGCPVDVPANGPGVQPVLPRRAGVPRLSGCLPLARWVPLPALRPRRGVRPAAPAALAVQVVRLPGLGHGRHDPAPHPDVAPDLVLGGLLDDRPQAMAHLVCSAVT